MTVKGKRSKSLVAEEMEERVRGTSRILREDILFVLEKKSTKYSLTPLNDKSVLQHKTTDDKFKWLSF